MAKSKYLRKTARRRRLRQERADRLVQWKDKIVLYCAEHAIEMSEHEGGYQFRRAEYVLTWWPSSNKIQIQSKGGAGAQPFRGEPRDDQPKILLALESLVKVT